jgi:anti-sigma factor RsiW
MLIPNHPDPERLSALASGETDATADVSLSEHLSTCDRCTGLLDELGAIRMSLAELPDIAPHRPLRLLPEAAADPAAFDRLGGWARRVFAPVLTAGAALAMVGLIGTASPALDNLAAGGQDASTLETDDRLAAPDASGALAPAGEGEGFTADQGETAVPLQSDTDGETTALGGDDGGTDQQREALRETPADRSPWPMVLFGGVALMVAAALMRWILVPRAA